MFDRLTQGLSQLFTSLSGKSVQDAQALFLAAIRDQLLDADTHPAVVDDLLARLQSRLSADPTRREGQAASEFFMTEFRQEVLRILGQNPEPLRLKTHGTSSIMVVGLQGTGKTTSVGKLAQRLHKQGKKVMLVPLDVRRPAAIEQLKILGQQIGVPVWPTRPDAKPLKEAKEALRQAEKDRIDVALFDTAGRLSIDQELMAEVVELRRLLRPQEILYVMDAMAGQTALNYAESFAKAVQPTGMVITKVDADPRGGAVLSVRARTGIAIKFVGVGEKMDALEVFTPARIVNRLLDQGELEELAEKFDQMVDAKEAEVLSEKMLSAKFNLDDLAKQLEMMRNLGPIEGVLKMLPGGQGLSKQLKNLDLAEGELKQTLAIIRSMTPKERQNPKLIGTSRIARIAKGSGHSNMAVKRVLKKHEQMQKMMKQLKRFPLQGLQNMLGQGGGFGGGAGLPPGLFGR